MSWFRAAKTSDLRPGAVKRIEVVKQSIALFRLGSGIYATQADCPLGGRLDEGSVKGDYVECSDHETRYHIPTGKASGGSAIHPLKCFSTRIDGADIFLMISEIGSDIPRRWIRAMKVSDLPEGGMREIDIGTLPLLVYRLSGKVYASSAICTHEFARLAGGYIDGESIECPLHQALFHIPTGKVEEGPAREPLGCYPAEVRGGEVWVSVPDFDQQFTKEEFGQ